MALDSVGKIESVGSQEVKTQHKKLKPKSSIHCLLMLRSWFTKVWKTLGDPNEFLENNPVLNLLAAPSTKHNIV